MKNSSSAMASERRLQRLDQVLREELSKILDREIEFPEGAMVTITRIGVSPDARYATAFISVIGSSEKGTLEILGKNVYPIQQIVNRRLRMRPVPKIRFVIDEDEERREGVEKKLAELKREGEV